MDRAKLDELRTRGSGMSDSGEGCDHGACYYPHERDALFAYIDELKSRVDVGTEMAGRLRTMRDNPDNTYDLAAHLGLVLEAWDLLRAKSLEA